ncbi:hypothetical protein BC834DRAFT_305980 [Gloeopeniophorella convolvens]|nr:hypothetical protein BC834DRAFT_305980 [Gloeopeniophorella convolvens]
MEVPWPESSDRYTRLGCDLGSIGIILRAMKKVGADYDGIIDIYNSIARFLERLRVYISVSTPHLWEVLVKTIAELLSISSTITKWVQQGLLKTFRKAFMGSTEITDALKRLDKLTNEELSMAVAEILRVIRNVSRDVSTVKGGLTEIQRNELKRRFRDWLSPPNPMTNHHEARSVRHRGSATWLIQGETFKKWKLEGTLLWIHGKVGSGKTVLCSAIIDDLWPIVKTESASVAYFYCDFQDPAKQDVHGILLSFLIQLCEQSDTYLNILSGLSSSFPEGSPSPAMTPLWIG